MVLGILLAASAAATGVMPYPGSTYLGELAFSEGQPCAVSIWHGLAIESQYLNDSERRELEDLIEDVSEQWVDGDLKTVKGPLLKRFYALQEPSGSAKGLPIHTRAVSYEQMRLLCGDLVVRSGFARLPNNEGYILAAWHPETGAYLVQVDYNPAAKELADEVAGFYDAYKAELESSTSEEEVSEEARKVLRSLATKTAKSERDRIRFWDINGLYLPDCPGGCPDGTVAWAWAKLAPKDQRAFALLLGVLAGTSASTDSIEGEGMILGNPQLWPDELGQNPYTTYQGRLDLIKSDRLRRTFTRPEGAVIRDIFGSPDGSPPVFDGGFKQFVKAIRKAVR